MTVVTLAVYHRDQKQQKNRDVSQYFYKDHKDTSSDVISEARLMSTDVVFSAFDDRIGPVPVFSTVKDSGLTKTIALKSFVSTLSMSGADDPSMENIEGEAIIPFPAEDRIAFIYYTRLVTQLIITLSVVIPYDNRLGLYARATALSRASHEVKQILNTEYVPGESLSNNVIQKITNLINVFEAGQAPAVQAPAVQAPAVQAPAVQAPAVQAPAVQAPAVQAPAVQAPAVQEQLIVTGLEELYSLYTYKEITPFLYGLLLRIPVILVTRDIPKILEITDGFLRRYIPYEVNVGLILEEGGIPFSTFHEIPRSDVIILKREQFRRKYIHTYPVISISRETRYHNYDPPKKIFKLVENIAKTSSGFKNELQRSQYLKEELSDFHKRLDLLKQWISAGRIESVKYFAKTINVKSDYVIALAESLILHKEVPAEVINKTFRNETDFQERNIAIDRAIGLLRPPK
ncbi:MAG: hypothetical protein ACFFD4_27540 [Candidatus Odinarchaeota archaeon]